MDAWDIAQQKETAWWGDCTNTADEEAKQLKYAAFMGIDEAYRVKGSGWFYPPFDMQGKSVLDIGGGPVSLLLKCTHRGRSVVADPASWPAWVHDRYGAASIEYVRKPVEELDLGEVFDEVWMYNVLQHVQDPARVIEAAKRHAKSLRVFEWLDTEINEMHPHALSAAWLDEHLGVTGTVHHIEWERYVPKAYSAVIKLRSATLRLASAKVGFHRFHLLGLAHLPTSTEFSPCAYTQKVVKLARMLKSLGHTVMFYGGEGSQVECDEFIQVVSEAERKSCYGDYDWRAEFFKHDGNDAAYTAFNANAIEAIKARKQPGDFILFPMGNYNKAVAEAHGDLFCVESGIGYRGVFSRYRVFESYAWMHYLYGILNQADGSWYDAVIPNYFDPADFPYQENKGDYFLFIGRLISRKGVDLAAQVCERLGVKLVLAGQGVLDSEQEGLKLSQYRCVEHVGTVGAVERARLMGGARAVFSPTYYIGPFEGVAVEAQMCGTPVIATDWGVFSETVLHGVTGFRCRTFDDFLWAARNIRRIKPQDCRDWAVANYSLARVAAMYQEYFSKLADLTRKGWYEDRPERADLAWLERRYPGACLP
jgi:glycosyltransferase involved in cell wall biosynthesis